MTSRRGRRRKQKLSQFCSKSPLRGRTLLSGKEDLSQVEARKRKAAKMAAISEKEKRSTQKKRKRPPKGQLNLRKRKKK